MTWDDFLEVNGQALSDEEYAKLMASEDPDDEEYYHAIIGMEDTIGDLKELLADNGEHPDDIIDIWQDEVGDLFEVWTKFRVYGSKYIDDEIQVVWLFRDPDCWVRK